MNDNPILGKARIEPDGILTVEIGGEVLRFAKVYKGWSRKQGFWSTSEDRAELYNTEQDKGTKWQVQEFWKSGSRPAPWEDNTCRAPHPELPDVYCKSHDTHEKKPQRVMRGHRWSNKEEI